MNEDVMAGIQIAIDIADAIIATGDCSDEQEEILEAFIEVLQNYDGE